MVSDPSTFASEDAQATLAEASQTLQAEVGDAVENINTELEELCSPS